MAASGARSGAAAVLGAPFVYRAAPASGVARAPASGAVACRRDAAAGARGRRAHGPVEPRIIEIPIWSAPTPQSEDTEGDPRNNGRIGCPILVTPGKGGRSWRFIHHNERKSIRD